MNMHHYLLPLLVCLPLQLQAETITLPQTVPLQTSAAIQSQQHYPQRGMTMKQVKSLYGAPRKIRVSKGKVKKLWPRITEWNYGSFSVYFEKHLVLHTVVR